MFLAAWLATSFGFGAFTTVRGQLNEQFFTYLMPGAIIAVVVAADAVVTQAASGVWRRPWPRRFRRLAIALPIAVVAWIVVLGTTSWYGTYHAGTDDGIQRTSQFIAGELQPCDFVNGGGEVARYAYNLPSERTSDFSSGPRALSRGVHYFLLRPKDVWARYGNMTPDFAEWIQTNGVLVASFESETYWGSQIWHVATGPYDPVADIQPIDDGFFVNTVGSACGGYEIRGTRIGDMVQAYRSYGGKRVVGRPRSTHWNVEDGRLQLFDAAVFKSVRDADGRLSTAPIDLITELMRRSPGFSPFTICPSRTSTPRLAGTAARVRLTDDGIARAYLGVPLSVATSEDWTRARERWGDPISLPVRLANGTVRQAFDRVVWERRREKVDLTVIADAVIDSGMVPVSARRISPVPRLETARATDAALGRGRALGPHARRRRPRVCCDGGVCGGDRPDTVSARLVPGGRVRDRSALARAGNPIVRLIVDLRVLHVPNWQLHHYPLRLTRALSRIPGVDVTAVVQTGRVRPRVAQRLLGPTVRVAMIDAAIGSREQDGAWADLISQQGVDALLIPYLPGAPRPKSVPTILVVATLPTVERDLSGGADRGSPRDEARGPRCSGSYVPSARRKPRCGFCYGRSLPIRVVRPGTSIRRVRASRRHDGAPIQTAASLDPRRRTACRRTRLPHPDLRIFERVADDDRSLGLVLLGPIERVVVDSIALLAGDLGISDQVLVLDEVGDQQLSSLLGAASCFAVASSLDHLAPLLPDALAAGLPTVASDVPCVRDMSGTAAILVPPGDIAAWEAALEAILTDEALTTRLSQVARAACVAPGQRRRARSCIPSSRARRGHPSRTPKTSIATRRLPAVDRCSRARSQPDTQRFGASAAVRPAGRGDPGGRRRVRRQGSAGADLGALARRSRRRLDRAESRAARGSAAGRRLREPARYVRRSRRRQPSFRRDRGGGRRRRSRPELPVADPSGPRRPRPEPASSAR